VFASGHERQIRHDKLVNFARINGFWSLKSSRSRRAKWLYFRQLVRVMAAVVDVDLDVGLDIQFARHRTRQCYYRAAGIVGACIIGFLVFLMPGIICYEVYRTDTSCDEWIITDAFLNTSRINPQKECCSSLVDGRCPDDASCFGGYATYQFTVGNLTAWCGEMEVVQESDLAYLQYQMATIFALGTNHTVWYSANQSGVCRNDMCQKTCTDWPMAFWIPVVIVIGLALLCFLLINGGRAGGSCAILALCLAFR
jgi:hypothetical protein